MEKTRSTRCKSLFWPSFIMQSITLYKCIVINLICKDDWLVDWRGYITVLTKNMKTKSESVQAYSVFSNTCNLNNWSHSLFNRHDTRIHCRRTLLCWMSTILHSQLIGWRYLKKYGYSFLGSCMFNTNPWAWYCGFSIPVTDVSRLFIWVYRGRYYGMCMKLRRTRSMHALVACVTYLAHRPPNYMYNATCAACMGLSRAGHRIVYVNSAVTSSTAAIYEIMFVRFFQQHLATVSSAAGRWPFSEWSYHELIIRELVAWINF